MEFAWISLTLLSAFSVASQNAALKRAYAAHDEYLVTWTSYGVTAALLLLILPFVPVPLLGPGFYLSMSVGLPLEMVAAVLYIKALKISPLSLTLPFLSLTPVFLIVSSYLIVGEQVSATGALGILLIAFGGYTLNLSEAKKGLLQPFFAIARERGSLYMIVVALIYSVTASLGKRAVTDSSPLFFAVSYLTGFFLLLTPLALVLGRRRVFTLWTRGNLTAALLPGACEFVATITYVLGLSLARVAYVISVRRLSVLFGVLFGLVLFRERGFSERLAGTLLMLAGFAVIALSR